MANLLLKLMQGYFKVLGTVAPRLAGIHAARFFLTPLPRRGMSRWSEELRNSARHVTLQFREQPIDGWLWGSGPRVLLVHGWGGIAAHFAAFIKPLVDAGFEVMAVDGPAHGRSPEKQTNLVRFSELLLQLERDSPEGLAAVVGHSFGASAVMAGLKRGLNPGRVALLSPFSSTDRNIESFAKAFQLSNKARVVMRERMLEQFSEYLYVWDLAKLARDFRQPALIIHDPLDNEVPFSESEAIVASWPGAKLLSIPDGLGHFLILRDSKVIGSVIEFLSEPQYRNHVVGI